MDNDSTSRVSRELRSWAKGKPPGTKLPSSRELLKKHHVSALTVQKAMNELVAEGLIETRPGAGSFIAAKAATRAVDYSWQIGALSNLDGGLGEQIVGGSRVIGNHNADAVRLDHGYPDIELLPDALVRRALRRAVSEGHYATVPHMQGLQTLREWFATEVGRHTRASDVQIVPGSQSALAAIFSGVVGEGNPLLIESPSYWGAFAAAKQARVRLVPVSMGDDGPDARDVERLLKATGARAFYAQPTFHNPTGRSWSSEVRADIMASLKDEGAFLIEDDWARDFGIGANVSPHSPIAADDPDGRVVYLRSLSKSLGPSIRVAAVVAKGPAFRRISAEIQAQSMYVSGLLQQAAVDVLRSPAWKTHKKKLALELEQRLNLMVQALAEELPTAHVRVPRGGLNLWVQLTDDLDLDQLVKYAEQRGVMVSHGDQFFPSEPSGNFLRVNFSGAHPERFHEAIKSLKGLL